MFCNFCGKESIGEVCNSCIRSENQALSTEWIHKTGLLGTNKTEYKLAVSNIRISGTAIITMKKDLLATGRVDNFLHSIKSVKEVWKETQNKKETLGIHIQSPNGSERYLYFIDVPNIDSVINCINKQLNEI